MTKKKLLALKAVVLNLALVIGACASSNGHYRNYQHPEYGQAEFDRDWYECRKENEKPSQYRAGAFAGTDIVVDKEMASACLRARGWQKQEQRPASEQPEYLNTPSRPAATRPQIPNAFSNIRTAEDMQKNLDSWRQDLDRAVASGKLTQEEADRAYQEREEFLRKRLSNSR